jgi:hypothetical protein
MTYQRLMIAPGHDNPLAMQHLHELNPPLFADFELGVELEWHDSEGAEYDGDNELVLIGPKMVIAKFGAVYTAEHKYLKATFATSKPRTGPVTIQVHDRDTDTWPVYNATLELPNTADLPWLFNAWEGYDVKFYDLELVWEEADAPTFYVFSDSSLVTFTDGSYATPGA